MECTNQQVLTNDIEDHGQTIKNRSEMKIGSQGMNKIFLAFLIFKIKVELKIKERSNFKITSNQL